MKLIIDGEIRKTEANREVLLSIRRHEIDLSSHL